MSEGKLKKRVLEIEEKTKYLAPECRVCNHEFWVPLIDEAKQEFMKIAPELKLEENIKLWKELDNEGHANGYVKLLLAIIKWFGDSS